MMTKSQVTFEKTARQAAIAFACLAKQHGSSENSNASKLSDDGLAYLLHAGVLFFLRRDQLAWVVVFQSPLWGSLNLQAKLRQLPTYAQLMAVLKSQGVSDEALLSRLATLSDEALEVTHFKAFRDYVLINGVPDDGLPFDTPAFDDARLMREALSGWEKLQVFSSLPLVSSP